ncbi:MAG: helix-turn-helix transcriptional regulator [Gammaproteobacteria bacterium]
MASDHSTGTDRPAEVAYPNLGYSSAAGVREPDPPSYGKSPSETARRLGMTVRLLRLSRGWSQETLAELAGLDRTFIGAVERAERNITLASAEKLANAFDMTVAELLSPYGRT